MRVLILILLFPMLCWSQYGEVKKGYVLPETSSCTDDTCRIFAQMTLTRAQKDVFAQFLTKWKTVDSRRLGTTEVYLSDGWHFYFIGANALKVNVPIEWTGQHHIWEKRTVSFLPFIGAWSNNQDSAHYITDFKYSDISTKTAVSMFNLVRRKHDATYSGGDFQYPNGVAVYNDSSGKIMSLPWDDNRCFMSVGGEHTAVLTAWAPYSSWYTRNGTAIGTDSIFLYYDNFRLAAPYHQQTPLDSVSAADSTMDLLACNFNGVHKHFDTRQLAYFGISKGAINSNFALSYDSILYWLDSTWNIVNDHELDSLIARMTSPNDSDIQGYRDFYGDIKKGMQIAHLTDKFAFIHLYIADSWNNGKLDLTSNKMDAAIVGSTSTFIPYGGIQLGASTSINTGWNSYTCTCPTVNNTSKAFGFLCLTVAVSNGTRYLGGAAQGGNADYEIIKWSDGKFYGQMWATYTSSTYANTKGLFSTTTTAANDMRSYWNDSLLASNTANRGTLNNPNANMYTGANNNNGTIGNFSEWKFAMDYGSKGLTPAEIIVLVNATKRFCLRKDITF